MNGRKDLNTGQASAVTPAHSKQLQFPKAQKKKANTDSTSSASSHTEVIIQMTKGKKKKKEMLIFCLK